MKKYLVFLFIVFCASPSWASTYYTCNSASTCGSGWATGSDSNAGTSMSAPLASLAGAFKKMSGGDQLIIGNGTYTGSSNYITNQGSTNVPPAGTSGAYTDIKAQNDGGVLFDGQNSADIFDYESQGTSVYWQFEGINWGRSTSSTVTICAEYFKFLRCGAYDTGAGNTDNFFLGHCSYGLCENCYAWGSGRYKFCAWQSDHMIFRSCVARTDIVNTTENGNANQEPMSVFTMYSVTNGLVQNCIAIDTDQTANYGAEEYHGMTVPSTDADANTVTWENSILLNVKTGGIETASNSFAARSVTFKNCVLWNVYDALDPTVGVNLLEGVNDLVEHCTFGAATQNSGDAGYYFNTYSNGSFSQSHTIKDNLIYGVTGTGTMIYSQNLTQDYNYYYGNTVTVNNSGTHDKKNVNFKWSSANTSGGLKYLPEIEAGSNISGVADDGGDIGANVKTLIGTPGTLYGQTGYDTDTGVSMWPYPNETLIKTKMAAYSENGVSGTRGFCATGNGLYGGPITLTSYIWEYLGNAMPSSIYGAGGSSGGMPAMGNRWMRR